MLKSIENSCNAFFCVNPFPIKPWFSRVCCTSLLTILREKEEITRNEQFPLFSHGVFTLLENFLPFFLSNLKLSSANTFSLEESKIFRFANNSNNNNDNNNNTCNNNIDNKFSLHTFRLQKCHCQNVLAKMS